MFEWTGEITMTHTEPLDATQPVLVHLLRWVAFYELRADARTRCETGIREHQRLDAFFNGCLGDIFSIKRIFSIRFRSAVRRHVNSLASCTCCDFELSASSQKRVTFLET